MKDIKRKDGWYIFRFPFAADTRVRLEGGKVAEMEIIDERKPARIHAAITAAHERRASWRQFLPLGYADLHPHHQIDYTGMRENPCDR